MVTASRLTEFKEHWDNNRAHGVILGDDALQDQELDSMILVTSFQLRCDICAHICRAETKIDHTKGLILTDMFACILLSMSIVFVS